jgi:hypothetical protein
MTPAWILDIFAAIMLAVAAVSAARLLVARPWERGSVITDTDIAHLLMAIAMAGMLTSSLTTLPSRAWEAIFGLMTAWFAYRVTRDARASGIRALAGGHCAPHLVHSAAMLYMFLALTAPAAGGSGMTGMTGSSGASLSYPTLALAFGFVLAGYSIWDLDQISGTRRAYATPATLAGPALATMPALAVAGPVPLTSAAAGSQDPAAETAPVVGPAATKDRAAFLLSPGVTVGCRIAMGVTMALMLFLMI